MAHSRNEARSDGRELLNQLFVRTAAYQSSTEFLELIRFIADFRFQSPYNAYLLRCQNPYVSFVASATEWEGMHGATIRRHARPLVILRPFGPVDFVYDISDVEGGNLPRRLREADVAVGRVSQRRLSMLLKSAQHHGIGFESIAAPDTFAGRATRLHDPRSSNLVTGISESPQLFDDPLFVFGEQRFEARFVVEVNKNLNREQTYATLLHELAHVLCGHLGPVLVESANKLSRDRDRIPPAVAELEAEAVAYITGARTGVEMRSEEYLAAYVERAMAHKDLINVDAIFTAAGDLEKWGERGVRPQKPRKSESTSRLRRRAMQMLDERAT